MVQLLLYYYSFQLLVMPLNMQITWLFVLSIPVACIAWTVTHEEVFSEFNTYCKNYYQKSKTLLRRKFFYLFTCEYCFSHYVTILALILTKYKLLLDDWRGYFIAGFSIVWIANCYMSIYAWLRTSLKKEKTEVKLQEQQLNDGNKSS